MNDKTTSVETEEKTDDKIDMRLLWLRFLNAETEEELEEIKNSGVPIMQKAVQVVYDLSEDPEIIAAVRQRERELQGDE